MNKIITISVLFFLALAWGIFFVGPKNEEFSSIKKEIEAKKTELRYKEEYFTNLEQVSRELENYETQLAKIDSTLPESPELPALFDFLQKSAARSGLVLTGLNVVSAISLPSAKEKTGFKETRLDLILTGSYSTLKSFLSELEKSARLIEVELLTLASGKEGIISSKIRIKVNSY